MEQWNHKPVTQNTIRSGSNTILDEDRPIHDWYRFVLAYPPHLVRDYLTRFGVEPGQTVLDPFCGTGTTLVECKKHGIGSIGLEANPMAHFASHVKTDWSPDAVALTGRAEVIADAARSALRCDGIDDDMTLYADQLSLRTLPPQSDKLLLTGSISPLPLHKALVLLEQIAAAQPDTETGHLRLAVAEAAVNTFSNLRFGPEVGVGPAKTDAPVIAPWLANVSRMAADLHRVSGSDRTAAQVVLADARGALEHIAANSIDAVITSPPYPNEKDYTRITRLESVLLGFITSRAELQSFKRTLIRSNTRNVYKGDSDDLWIDDYPAIQQLAAAIEARRLELGKTSGFEKLYARVTRLYFGGMARHLAELRRVLRPGALAAYVVGDQASFFRILIRTGQILAEIAERLGYEVVDIDLFRTRLATATREQLREEVVILRWPGK